VSSAGPEVTVLIATRNRARFLPDALSTALGQEDVELEVIVVDDASEDETPRLLAEVADSRLRVIRLDQSGGMGEARNVGIAAALGAWIALLDDDDLWAPWKLRRQLDAAGDAGATWVYCGVLLVSPEGDVVRMWGPPDPATVLPELLRRNVVQAAASALLVDAGRLRAVGGIEDGLATPWDLLIRLAVDGPAAAVDEPLVAYRRHASTFISSSRDQAMEEARHVAEKHRDLSLEHGIEFDLQHLEKWLRSERIRAGRHLSEARLREGRRGEAARVQLRTFAASRSARDLRRLLRIVVGERVRAVARRTIPAAELREGAREPIPDWLSPYLVNPGDVRRSSSSTVTAGTAGATSERAKTTLKP
jgi:glycosyltransferase involved in cell wall biosynthesis